MRSTVGNSLKTVLIVSAFGFGALAMSAGCGSSAVSHSDAGTGGHAATDGGTGGHTGTGGASGSGGMTAGTGGHVGTGGTNGTGGSMATDAGKDGTTDVAHDAPLDLELDVAADGTSGG